MDARRVRGRITSISWIPDEAVTGMAKVSFDHGLTHYDQPPPDVVRDVDELRRWAEADRFRFANHLSAWADVENGVVVDAGFDEDSVVVMGGSTLQLGPFSTRLAATPLPEVRHDPVLVRDRASLTQSAGGRAALPAPRRVTRAGLRVLAPLVWTTLQVTLAADGTVRAELTGASRFPRHWVYGPDGALVTRTGVADFDAWFHGTTVETTPWGGDDTPAVTAAVESALERQLVQELLQGRDALQPTVFPAGHVLTRQGEPGGALVLLLDGLVEVQVDGRVLGELGPGVLLGERALLEGGRRTATLTASTPVRIAPIDSDHLDREALRRLSGHHRREEADA